MLEYQISIIFYYELTLLGWACIDRDLFTDSTLKRNGSCPAVVNCRLTLLPTASGWFSSHSDRRPDEEAITDGPLG